MIVVDVMGVVSESRTRRKSTQILKLDLFIK